MYPLAWLLLSLKSSLARPAGGETCALFYPFNQPKDYLHNNPVEQGFVNKAEDYPWSSEVNYIGEEGVIEIDFIS